MDAAPPNPLAALTHEDVVAICSSRSGKHWTKVSQAIVDYGVDGAWIGQHIQSVQALHSFFEEELEVDGPKKAITRQLRELLLRAKPGNLAGGRGAERADGGTGAHTAGRGGGHKPTAAVLTSVRVQFTPYSRADDGDGGSKQITIGVPSPAPPRTVLRCLLDRLGLHLSTTIVLTHAGRRLDGDQDLDWAALSIVYAAQLAHDTPLTLDNLPTHPVMASHVRTADIPQAAGEAAGAEAKGWCLDIGDDDPRRNLLGRGAFGEVYSGTSTFAGRSILSAVKKFFIIQNPTLYGLYDAAAVAQWANQELLPEINTLLGLAHPNVVRLRCVGACSVFDQSVPAYVAMDFCTEGTVEQWIKERRLTDDVLPVFLWDFVSAMVYLHVEKHIVHRDLKPANIFVRRDPARDGRPALVVGDVGLAKEMQTTIAKASAAGTPMYFAPELTGAAPRCSLASDVFSAGLIVVEMVTGVCVFTHAGEKAAVAAKDVGGAQAKAATRDAAAAGAKAALVSQATERLKTVLAFAQDSPLTLEAMQMLAQACTKDDPACRCSFRDVQQLCRPVGQQESGGARGGSVANALELQRLQAALQGAEERAAREREARELAEAQAAQQQQAAAAAEEQRIPARAEAEAREAREHTAEQAVEQSQAKEEETRAASLNKLSQWSGGSITVWSVRGLNLAFKEFRGSIPTEIGLLVQLTDLQIYSNQLTGPIPTEIGQLVQLTDLQLWNNQLTGAIPTQIGQLIQLESLGLERNQLIGPIPTQIGQLVQLEELYLSSNQLTGPIPTQIGELVQLEDLQLFDNQLTGPIPTQIGELVQLDNLVLSNNQLTDTTGFKQFMKQKVPRASVVI